MAKIKSYSDLQQSKKLAEILPLESADMWYQHTGFNIKDGTEKLRYFPMVIRDYESDEDIPCWSLAALLEEIPSTIVNIVGEDLKLHINKDNLQYYLFYENEYTGDMFEIETELYDDMIDACVAMIEKLHELKML